MPEVLHDYTRKLFLDKTGQFYLANSQPSEMACMRQVQAPDGRRRVTVGWALTLTPSAGVPNCQ